jgi:hypothetical protein
VKDKSMRWQENINNDRNEVTSEQVSTLWMQRVNTQLRLKARETESEGRL